MFELDDSLRSSGLLSFDGCLESFADALEAGPVDNERRLLEVELHELVELQVVTISGVSWFDNDLFAKACLTKPSTVMVSFGITNIV